MSSRGAAVSLTMVMLTTSICSAFPPSERHACLYVLCDCQFVACTGVMVQNHLQTVAYKVVLLYMLRQMRMDQSFKMRKQETNRSFKVNVCNHVILPVTQQFTCQDTVCVCVCVCVCEVDTQRDHIMCWCFQFFQSCIT